MIVRIGRVHYTIGRGYRTLLVNKQLPYGVVGLRNLVFADRIALLANMLQLGGQKSLIVVGFEIGSIVIEVW